MQLWEIYRKFSLNIQKPEPSKSYKSFELFQKKTLIPEITLTKVLPIDAAFISDMMIRYY